MRSLTYAAILTVVSSVFCARNTHGALTEFTFGGTFTETTGSVHQPGQPFTSVLLFDSTAVDDNPSPENGRYPYISWSVPGATANPVVFDNPPLSIGDIRIDNEPPTDQFRLEYRGAFNFGWFILLELPADAFASDALPASFDISQATTRGFAASDTNLTLRGTIDSLTARVIPEPSAAALFALAPIVFVRRNRG